MPVEATLKPKRGERRITTNGCLFRIERCTEPGGHLTPAVWEPLGGPLLLFPTYPEARRYEKDTRGPWRETTGHVWNPDETNGGR